MLKLVILILKRKKQRSILNKEMVKVIKIEVTFKISSSLTVLSEMYV